jgi:hypothetical protein
MIASVHDEAFRRNKAASVFYSLHPLVLAYFDATGADEVSCKELCNWVAAMPTEQFSACIAGDSATAEAA